MQYKAPKKYLTLHGIEIKSACTLLDAVNSKIKSQAGACPFHVGHACTGYARVMDIKIKTCRNICD